MTEIDEQELPFSAEDGFGVFLFLQSLAVAGGFFFAPLLNTHLLAELIFIGTFELLAVSVVYIF